MPSRISQMRNGTPYQIPQQQQQMLNDSIKQVRGLMQQVRNAQNPQAALAQMLQNNPNTPMLSNLLSSGNNLQTIATQMAQSAGIDINQLINRLQGGV